MPNDREQLGNRLTKLIRCAACGKMVMFLITMVFPEDIANLHSHIDRLGFCRSCFQTYQQQIDAGIEVIEKGRGVLNN